VRAWLDGPRPWRWAALIGFLALLPALGIGLNADDHLLRANLSRDPRFPELHTAPWDAFHFYPRGFDAIDAIERGFGPWWTHPDMHAHHMRPLTSLTHWAELRLWPDQPWLMHLHSALWYAAVCAVVAALYRKLLPGWAAGLAALFYAVDYSHGTTAAWIANRNALISGAFGFAALLLHHQRRRGLAAAALALGLAAGETALGACAYLSAHVVCLETGALAARARSLAPYLAVGALWLAFYASGDHGVAGSGMYLDPRGRTAEFLRALPAHAALELGSELGAPGPDMWPVLDTGGRALLLGLAVAALALATLALAPLRRDPLVRFLALGSVLAVIPVSATFPSARLMLVPGFGLIGLVARAVVAWREREREPWARGRRSLAVFAVVAGGGHLVLAPPLFLFTQQQTALIERWTADLARGLPDDPALASKRLVMVNPPDPLLTLYLRPKLASDGRVVPAGAYLLGLGTHALEVERVDARTLLVRDPSGFYDDGFSALVRPPDAAMPPGTRVVAPSVTAEVVEAAASGVPTAVRFTFVVPLEDPSLFWTAWDGATLVPFAPPPVGARVALPAHRNPLRMF
jgi:hypothetical protein